MKGTITTVELFALLGLCQGLLGKVLGFTCDPTTDREYDKNGGRGQDS